MTEVKVKIGPLSSSIKIIFDPIFYNTKIFYNWYLFDIISEKKTSQKKQLKTKLTQIRLKL